MVNADNHVTIASLGGIPPLIALLGGGSDEAKVHAARALANLALNDDNKATITTMGGMPPLSDGSDDARPAAAGAFATHTQTLRGLCQG